VKSYQPIFCPSCGQQQERYTVIRRMREGKTFLFCPEDGEKIILPKEIERLTISNSRESRAAIVHEHKVSYMRTTYETALVRVKGFIRNRNDPTLQTCFVSYAWGETAHERKVLQLADDLRRAGIDVSLDQWDNSAIGGSIARFASLIELTDFIIVVGTPSYRLKYENKLSQYGSMVAAEVDLINVRLTGTEAQKASVLPVLFAGSERISFPPLLQRPVYADFTHEEEYFITLYDLVLTIYSIAFTGPIVQDLRAKLRDEANALILKR